MKRKKVFGGIVEIMILVMSSSTYKPGWSSELITDVKGQEQF